MYFDGSRIDAERRCKSYAYRGMYRSESERERERERDWNRIDIVSQYELSRARSLRAIMRALNSALIEP